MNKFKRLLIVPAALCLFTMGQAKAGVELQYVDGNQKGSKVHLEWVSNLEMENEMFNVQRSTDGIVYQDIGQLTGAGNSWGPLPYEFWDNNAINGNIRYRLRMVDVQEVETYSTVVTVSVNKPQFTPVIQVTPTVMTIATPPSVKFRIAEPGVFNLEIFGIGGRTLVTDEVFISPGDIYTFEDPPQQAGVYIISVSSADFVSTQKIVVTQ